MSILLFEGFETVGTELGIGNQGSTRPRIHLRWDSTTSGGIPSTDSYFLITDIFSEGYAIQMGSNGFSNGNRLVYDVPTALDDVGPTTGTEFIVGFRAHIPSTARTASMFSVKVSGADDLSLNFVDSTDLQLSRFVGGQMEIELDVLTPGAWHYIEMRFLISSGSSSNGLYEVYLDGNQVWENLAARTNGNFGSDVQSMSFRTTNASTGEDYVGYDDIYLLQVDGNNPNAFIGSGARVISLPPDGDDTTEWGTSTGTVHYSLIDENGADDADFIIHGVDTERDLFTCTDISAAGEVHSVKVEVEALAIAETTHSIDVELKNNTTTVQTNHNVTDSVDYDVFTHYADDDPNTSAAWTNGGVDTMKVGVQFNT